MPASENRASNVMPAQARIHARRLCARACLTATCVGPRLRGEDDRFSRVPYPGPRGGLTFFRRRHANIDAPTSMPRVGKSSQQRHTRGGGHHARRLCARAPYGDWRGPRLRGEDDRVFGCCFLYETYVRGQREGVHHKRDDGRDCQHDDKDGPPFRADATGLMLAEWHSAVAFETNQPAPDLGRILGSSSR
jgi:hypothetical protein